VAKGLILGVIVALAGVIAGGYIFVKVGALPAGQDAKPGKLETWAAKTSLAATINPETRGLTSPVQPTESNCRSESLCCALSGVSRRTRCKRLRDCQRTDAGSASARKGRSRG
jgi:hypothetical protein